MDHCINLYIYIYIYIYIYNMCVCINVFRCMVLMAPRIFH